MLIHLIETERHRLWLPGSTLWSTVAHAALVASAVGATLPSAADRAPKPAPQREVVYLLPALPAGPRVPTEPGLRFSGGQVGAEPTAREGTPVPRGTARPPASSAASSSIVPVVLDSVERAGNPVFVAAELDRVVERDPTSASPAYPAELQRQLVEGGVSAEWVVDSVGLVDTTTFRVVTASHPDFAHAVRAVLPLMRFRPAELAGRHVAQLVHQDFMFRITLEEAPPIVTQVRNAARP